MTDAQPRLGTTVIAAAVLAILVAATGAALTDTGPWYESLKTPDWKPADWVFGPVWTMILTLCAAAGILAWRRTPSRQDRLILFLFFALNAFLNVSWSFLFFTMQRPDWALIEVALLWASIVALIFAVAKWSSFAAVLLTPYLVWVTTASVLNYEIVQLNGPFS